MSHIAAIQKNLGALDALILTDPISIRYASGFTVEDGAAVIGKRNAWLITDSRYVEAAKKVVSDMIVLCVSRQKPPSALLRQIVVETGSLVGAEENRMSQAAWQALGASLNVTLKPAGDILSALRASKDDGEVVLLTAAQRIAEKALDEVLGIIKPGMTEKQVAAELVYRMYKYGGEANAFDPIVVTGANTSMPHGTPGQTVIRKGDFVTMDFGTKFGGYCSDMTRTVAVGKPSDKMREIYAVVLEAQLAGIAMAKPGVPGKEIDAAARRIIDRAGYGEYFGHGFGHSLGLEIHENPGASASNDQPMPEGAVISAEPGIYIPGLFGVRIEDVLWLRDGGAHIITRAPKELIIL